MQKEINLIRRTFPDLKFSKVKETSHGIDHKVLILDGKFVFRFPKENEYKDKIKIEMKFLDKLDSKYAPKYEWIGKDFGGYKLIKGKNLSKRSYNKIKNKNKFHDDVASFLTELHSYKSFPGLKKSNLKSSAQSLNKRMKVISKYLSKKQIEFTLDFIKIVKVIKFPNYCVTHSDLHNDHMLVDKELKGFIDFSDIEIGDPAVDFNVFWILGEEVVKKIYKKYNGPKDPDFLYRSLLYNFADYLSAIYHSDKEKPEWRKEALKRINIIISKELKLKNNNLPLDV